MKKLVRFLIIIPALLCSALFFVLGSAKDIKAVSSVGGDVATYSSDYYNKALIGSYYTDIFSSVDVDLTFNIPANYNLYDGYEYEITRYKINFGNYILSSSDMYSPQLQNIVCKVQQNLNSGVSKNVYDGTPTGAYTSIPIGAYMLFCNRSGTSSAPVFTNTTNYNFYSNNLVNPGIGSGTNVNLSVIYSYGSRSIYQFLTTSYNNNKIMGYLTSFNTNYSSYISASVSTNVYLDPSNVGNANGSQQTTKTPLTSYSYSCNPVTSMVSSPYRVRGYITFGGVSQSFDFSSPFVQSVDSNNNCVTSQSATFNTTLTFSFADIKTALSDDYQLFIDGITQDIYNYDPALRSIFSIQFIDGYKYNSMIPIIVKFKYNFNIPYSWLFNGLIYKTNVTAPQSSYSVPSIKWAEYSDIAEISWLALGNLSSSTAYNKILLFDDYRSPSSSYIEFTYNLDSSGSISSASELNSTYYVNFNFLYMNEQDFNNFSSIYGVTYRNCKVFDILCWLQNGFTYIIYEMPVVSPIINFVKSGISTITSFNSFMGNFTAWSGFIALISVPVTWLVIKKMMGGDK